MRSNAEILAYNRGQKDIAETLERFASQWSGKDGAEALIHFANLIREGAERSDQRDIR